MSNSEADAIYVDRDGVINALVPDPQLGVSESPLHPDDVTLMPHALDGLRTLRALGAPLIVASNQPAAAKGTVSPDELRAVHERVVALLAEAGIELDEWRYCLHRAEDNCDCRKPAPGMLREPAAAWMIGDVDGDVLAGQAAGARTILVLNPDSAHKRKGAAEADHTAPDLAAAARIVAG